MSDTPTTTPPEGEGPGDDIQPIQLQDEMERSFIDYAMSVIMSRALPDVRDGLKPVHRRIIWDMDQQGFRPNRAHVKSARVTGDTMAKYHPHGDTSVYDTMVRMAQDWSLRYPLIDPQGNFGNIDGDGPAAMRYTEARMRKITDEMLVSAAEAIASCVSDDQLNANFIVPSVFDQNVVQKVAAAVKKTS